MRMGVETMRVQIDGAKLKANMIRCRIGAVELAGALSVNRATVYRALRNGFVKISTLQKMEDYFHVQAGGLAL